MVADDLQRRVRGVLLAHAPMRGAFAAWACGCGALGNDGLFEDHLVEQLVAARDEELDERDISAASGAAPAAAGYCPALPPMSPFDAMVLSRLLWDAREVVSMFCDLCRGVGLSDPSVEGLVRRIDEYRAAQGWSPNGFGGER